MISHQQIIAARPPMGFAPFSAIVSQLRASVGQYDRDKQEEAKRKTPLRSKSARTLRVSTPEDRAKLRAKILALITDKGIMTTAIADIVREHRSNVLTHLMKMEADGIIKRIGTQHMPKWVRVSK
jgi:predicted Rossmann fold nucleotide-binding protein DprA/Smf involved in DNA uptake